MPEAASAARLGARGRRSGFEGSPISRPSRSSSISSSGCCSPATCPRPRPCSPTSRRCRPTCAASTASRCRPSPASGGSSSSYDEFPQQLVDAFTSAEDKTFFTHGGIDYPGLVGAVGDYISKVGSGERARGGSTITQQVAKNLLLGDEYSVTRKIKEAFLARRIESVLTKQQILALYLNQIFLGRNAYGVQAAARAYFDKDVDQLTLHEAAYLAILPKAPSNYDPQRQTQRALDRRNWVLAEMERNGKISAAQRAAAQAEPLGTVRFATNSVRNVGGYFVEEVRRQLMQRWGEQTEKGPNGVYTGGLWVRTSLDVPKQKAAETALRDGLMRYDRGKGWRDPGLKVDVDGDWRGELARAPFGVGYEDWRAAVVLSRTGQSATIGFTDGIDGHPARLCRGHAEARHRHSGLQLPSRRNGDRGQARRRRPGRFARSRRSRAEWSSRRWRAAGSSPCRAASTRAATISTAPSRPSASPARPSSRSSIRRRSTTA